MRKYSALGVSILSIFILCSLSYQPIVADEPIETITQVKESKAFDLDVFDIKELYTKLLELKSQSNDDCDCNKNTFYPFIRCYILYCLWIILWIIAVEFMIFIPDWYNNLSGLVYYRFVELNCVMPSFTYFDLLSSFNPDII